VSPTTYVFAATLEHRLGSHLVGSILYSGSHSSNLVSGGNQAGQVNYGQTSTPCRGDLIGKPPGSAPTRLNQSFGPIGYTQNDRYGNYNGITLMYEVASPPSLLRRFIHPLSIEGRCWCVPDSTESQTVLRAVPLGCPEPVFAQLQLRTSRSE